MNQKKADWVLVMVTVLWGTSYLFMKTGLDDLGIFTFIALRFLIAFIIMALFFHRALLHTDFRTLVYSLLQSLMLLGVFAFLMFGMLTTSASKVGFLNSLTVIFVPLLHLLITRRLPSRRMMTGAGVSLIGIFLLTGTSSLMLSSGDLFCIIGALFNAGYIIFAGHVSKQVPALAFSIWQMGFTGALSLLLALILEPFQLPVTLMAWTSVLGLAILCSAVGYLLQNIAQKYTSDLHAGLIFSLEPVFAALFAYLFVGERLSAQASIGAVLVLFSIVIMEIRLGDERKMLRTWFAVSLFKKFSRPDK
ncbi:DMT family transporter [Sporolactobacillus shoreicorticis]|uniref:DMT family transporter n=1 Tax=Sporolactobacillus shoreicorticis TaxID=1923877 RepID=A0ABW5S049_9BACL|nr:DMT family transporter [Sporolactobacillus shoreicorticis]MCO7126791.1 DMT family transporter [Sporolactobacillus shoreicorticis]